MSEELLPYYDRELTYIRNQAARFAQQHPEIAGRLKLAEGVAADPHVERMIEAFAYLNARTRHKLDDDFPELTESFLSVLYPHYQAPVPSLAIAQFDLDREQTQLTTGQVVPRHTTLETSDTAGGEACRFRTCYPVTLWPIDLMFAGLAPPPFAAPMTPYSSQSAAVLRLTLKCWAEKTRFADLEIDSLRFFLMAQPTLVFRLFELVLNDVVEIAFAGAPDDPAPAVFGQERNAEPIVRMVGFGPEEGLLPYSARSFVGYRLLTEFFAFPQKYLFFDLDLSHPRCRRKLQHTGNQLEVFFYVKQTDSSLEANVKADTFRMGCAPIVNLYSKRAEPVKLSETEFEYRVAPDIRSPLAHEIYSIDRVTASDPHGRQVEYKPFFSMEHALARDERQPFWQATRKTAEPGAKEPREIDHGTEIFLSIVDLEMQGAAPADWTLGIETTCLNRDLPARLPFRAGRTTLQMTEETGVVARVICLTRPTPTLRPALRKGTLWRLISHLTLNYLSLGGEKDQADALREILTLYDFRESPETRQLIAGLVSVATQPAVGRITHPIQGSCFCRGVQVTIQLDPDKFVGSGMFLFAAVLERFLSLYCSVNSFSRLVARVKGRNEVFCEWQPRVGERLLL